MSIHPKTSAAAVFGSLGVVVVSVLTSFHGINLSPEANAAIPTFMSALGSFVVPGNDTQPDPPAPPAA